MIPRAEGPQNLLLLIKADYKPGGRKKVDAHEPRIIYRTAAKRPKTHGVSSFTRPESEKKPQNGADSMHRPTVKTTLKAD